MEQKLVRSYSDSEKLQIIDEFLNSGESMDTFQTKYGMGHCTLSRWMIKFGLKTICPPQFIEMKEKQKSVPEKSLREQTLEAKIAKLEKELEAEKLKAEAYNALIEVAEEELGIDIRKKAGAKQ
ncbi:MAG: hypothetical protein IIZ90_01805 [Bacteroidales bacterium]|jgi:transposase-like protein|nr:hypothetical protein [Bacteroidales bacterium]